MSTHEVRLEDARSGGERSTSNDEQLLVAAKSGHSAAFGTLYESHRLKLYRSVLRILRHRQDAEDAVQRAFQRAVTNLDGFREDSAFSTWVTRIAINEFQAKRYLRRHLESTYKTSSCLMQRSERRAPCSQPPCISGSLTPNRNIIVGAETCTDDDGLSTFLGTRARLLCIAYRILKSAAEAEDLVQDVWIRWQTTDRTTVRNAAAFLTTMTARLAINLIRSARSRREMSFESSLRESVDTCPDPQLRAERSEQLRIAIVVLLEKLSPVERAAYVLREAFDYSYREIANILRLEEANVRQLVTRARQHVADRQHSSVNSAEQQSFLAAFIAAAQKGALAKLESFLVGSADRMVRKGKRPLRTSSTLAEPITIPRRHGWGLVPHLNGKVA